MRIISVVVAALLLVMIENHVAVAAENLEHKSKYANANLKQKKVDKILEMLRSIGISDPEITKLANEIGNRRGDGYFLLHEEQITGGNLSLRYVTEGKIGIKQLELHYAPENSNMQYSVRKNAAMMNYRLNF
ncbi:MAG: hypothetical protein AABY33_01270 [Pseudomonadota bacterium]